MLPQRIKSLTWTRTARFAAVGVLAFAGCESKPLDGGEFAQASAAEGAAIDRLMGTDHGLELRRWVIDEDAARIGAAMMEFADAWSPEPALKARLERSGLRLARVPLDRLGALQVALGQGDMRLIGWHGQMTQWTRLVHRSIPRGGQAIAIDGMVRPMEAGELFLMGRGWTLPTEDGPRMLLQLTPIHQPTPPSDTSSFIGRLGVRAVPDEVLHALWLELWLESDHAYVMTFESPDVAWTTGGSTAQSATASAKPEDVAATKSVPTGEGLGPEVSAPRTIGELLLRSDDGRPTRHVLVFVPRIPRALFPPPMASAGAGTASHAEDDHG